MKLFKTVLILSVAILSLGSSVAFGDCVMQQVTNTPVNVAKPGTPASSTQQPAQGSQAGSVGH